MMCMRVCETVIFASVALALIGRAYAQPTPTHANLTYAVVNGQPLRLDLYLPSGVSGPRPVVVWIHGGGWAGGDKFPPTGATAPLLQRGIAVASINYRLTTQGALFGPQAVIFPAQIHDCKAAVRWLRGNASTYNLDPTRFGSWGSSAGGHLSALLGTSGGVAAAEGTVGTFLGQSSRVQACADYFGPTDLLMMNPDVTTPPGSTIDHDAPGSPESHLLGWFLPGQGIGDIRKNLTNPTPPYPALAALAALVNPITHVEATDPPFFIAHGTADTLVPLNQSTRLATALSAAGVQNTYVQIIGAGHGTGFPPSISTQTVDFFDQEFDRISPAPAGDLNGDGVVNSLDLGIMLASWTLPPASTCSGSACDADLNGDQIVNSLDLGILLSLWTL